MSRHLKTENCVICGTKATLWHGYVFAKEKMALGNYIDKKIIAGFCNEHEDLESSDGYYGEYDNTKMGKCVDMF